MRFPVLATAVALVACAPAVSAPPATSPTSGPTRVFPFYDDGAVALEASVPQLGVGSLVLQKEGAHVYLPLKGCTSRTASSRRPWGTASFGAPS